MKGLMRVVWILFLVFSLHLTLFTSHSSAAVPRLINYQGRLTDASGDPLTGSYDVTFRIYDALTAGNLLWEEIHTGVVIDNGIFSTLLGSVTALNLAFDNPYFLEIKVGAEVLSPRQQIASSGYAIRSEISEKAVRSDSSDTTSGYLSDKADGTTLDVDSSAHKLRVKDAGINVNKLKTATGEVARYACGWGVFILPGGEYGFYPQTRQAQASDNTGAVIKVQGQGVNIGTSYATNICLAASTNSMFAQQRYVTASGKDHWIFLLIDKGTKDIIGAYSAPDHPSYGNGGDPDKLQHPFVDYDAATQEIILVDRSAVEQMKNESVQQNKSILNIIDDEYKPDTSKQEKYEPLHTGKFVDKKPEMVESLPRNIKVHSLIRMTSEERSSRIQRKQARVLKEESVHKKIAQDKDRAFQKLRDLGLSEDEVQALRQN